MADKISADIQQSIASDAASSGQWRIAIERWIQLLNDYPNHLPALIGQANALMQLSQFEKAEAAFRDIRQTFPNHIQGFLGPVQISFRLKQWELATDRCVQLAKKFPHHFQSHLWQAKIAAEAGQFDRANRAFAYLTQHYPKRDQGFSGLCQVAYRQKDWPQTVRRCDELLKQFPHHLQGHTWKGDALLELEQIEQAESTFNWLANRYPQKSQGYTGAIRCAIKMQRPALVLERCQVLLSKLPEHTQAKVWQGNALMSLDRLEQAETVFAQLASQQPQLVQGHFGLAQIAAKREHWALARDRFHSITEQFPQDLSGYVGKANALIRLEDFSIAKSHMHSLSSEQLIQIPALRVLALIALHTQDWDFAMQCVHLFLSDNIAVLATLDERNRIFLFLDYLFDRLLKSGTFAEAEDLLTKLKSYSVDFELLMIWQARTFLYKGDYLSAEALCTTALQQQQKGSSDLIYWQLAQIAQEKVALAEVIDYCHQIAVAESISYKRASILAARSQIRLNQVDLAKEVLQQLIKTCPNNASGYALLAEIYYFHDFDYQSALAVCDRAAQQNVSDEQLCCYRNLALSKLGRTNAAIRLTAQYLRQYPLNRLVMMARAEILRAGNRYKAALQPINRWLRAGDFAPICSSGDRNELNIQYIHCHPGYTTDKAEIVSVIMTTFCRDQLLPIAISSILRQTYTNIELIIVDDCSPDDTFDFLQTLAASDARIQLIRLNKNSGTYVAKNHGMAIATGKYVSFMDSDDWLHPQTIERQIERLQNSEALGVVCGFFRSDENSSIEFRPERPTNTAPITLCFERKPVIDKIGYFDTVRTAADTEYFLRFQLAFGQHRLRYLRFPLLISTRHSGSITGGGKLSLEWHGPGMDCYLYRTAFLSWHRQLKLNNASLFLPYPQAERRFEAPSAILQ